MNEVTSIKIASDFSDAPGARVRSDGPKSGQEFLEDLLEPRFKQALKGDGYLTVNLDDTWGYASSFISGSFGALAKSYGKNVVKKHLRLVSDEDSILIEKIMDVINTEGDSQ